MEARRPTKWPGQLATAGLVLMGFVPLAGLIVTFVAVLLGRAFAPAVVVIVPLYSTIVLWLVLLAWQISRGRHVFAVLGAVTSLALAGFWWFALRDIRREEPDVLEAGEAW